MKHIFSDSYLFTSLASALGAWALLSAPALAQANCPIGTNYCSSGMNSTGFPGLISATGSAAGSAGVGPGNAFTLRATQVPNTLGVFFHGRNQGNTPFGNGIRCVAGSIVRSAPILAQNESAKLTLQGSPFAAQGTTNFQYWFRDPAGGGALFDLTDGVSITFDGSGCPEMGINGLSTTTMAAGDVVVASGAGFGTDVDDLCARVSDGVGAGFLRAQSASGNSADLRLRSILPGTTSGQVMMEIGDGRTGIPNGLPADMTMVQDAWVWMGNGGPVTASDQIVQLTGASPQPAGCGYYWGGVVNGLLEIRIPASAPCPPTPRIDIALHGARTANNTFNGDYHAIFDVALPNPTALDCANRACAAITATFNDLFNVLVICSTSTETTSAGTFVVIKINAPGFVPFVGGWADIFICP